MKKNIVVAAIFGGLAVVLGAFAAHGLKAKLDANSLSVFETAVKYQFYHTLALLMLIAVKEQVAEQWMKYSANCFLIGIVLFSGSLYLLSTTSITGLSASWLGPITPLGGLFFIVGWACLAVGAVKKSY